MDNICSILTYHWLNLVLDDPDQHLVDVDAQVVHHMTVLREVKVPEAVLVLPVRVPGREVLENEKKVGCNGNRVVFISNICKF